MAETLSSAGGIQEQESANFLRYLLPDGHDTYVRANRTTEG